MNIAVFCGASLAHSEQITEAARQQSAPPQEEMPLKGDTVVGNDVWIGQNAVVLPGVHIGDGAIIGCNSVVGSHVPPYTIVAGNPAKEIRKRFDEELTSLLLRLQWWNLPVEEIKSMIPILTCNDLVKVKNTIKKKLSSRMAMKTETTQ